MNKTVTGILIMEAILLSACVHTPGSQILITEVCSRNNSVIADEDNDYKDWIELYNNSPQPISLEGFTLSNNPDFPAKWTFPKIMITPHSRLLVYASGKNKTVLVDCYEALVKENDSFKYSTQPAENFNEWISTGYNDSHWKESRGPFGYGYHPVNTSVMPQPIHHFYNPQFNYLYLRKTFHVSRLDKLTFLALGIDYDDAFIAYINGNEVKASQYAFSAPHVLTTGLIKEDIAFSKASAVSGTAKPVIFFPVSKKFLHEGSNVLAIKIISIDTSDIFCSASLKAGYADVNCSGNASHLPLYFLHTNFTLPARGGMVYLYDRSGNLADKIIFPKLQMNHSYGRTCDTGSAYSIYPNPSPLVPNAPLHAKKGYAPEPAFSIPSGFYNTTQTVEITTSIEPGSIRYTTDGSEPDSASALYIQPLKIDSTVVIKAKVFHDDYLPSETKSCTYLIREPAGFPAMSVSLNPDLLWNAEYGIFQPGTDTVPGAKFGANYWKRDELLSSVHYLDASGKPGFEQNLGLTIFGMTTIRTADCKSLKLTAHGDYGQSMIDCKIFPDRSRTKYKELILRNAGDDFAMLRLFGEYNHGVHFRNALAHSLAREMNMDYQSFLPVTLYLNGKYWGVYYLTEPIDRHYLSGNFHVPASEVNLLEDQGIYTHSVKDGSNEDYRKLFEYVMTHDLSLAQNYAYVEKRLDVADFINHFVLRIFLGEKDWPFNNDVMWKAEGENARWRFILKDADDCLNLYNYKNGWQTNDLMNIINDRVSVHAAMMRQLLRNDSFRQQFTGRFLELLNTTLSVEHLTARINEFARMLRPEMPRHLARWSNDTMQEWEKNVEIVRDYVRKRHGMVLSHLKGWM